jgi:uncharacterized protein
LEVVLKQIHCIKLFAAQLAVFSLLSGSALANDPDVGRLNPDEMSLHRSVERASEGDVDFVTCAQGYLLTKKGDHKLARIIFEECARQGFTGAMTWMSYLDDNGFGGNEDAVRASKWDLEAARKGDPIAQLNYGLDLLRGRGVNTNEVLARDFIDRAAKAGVKEARALQESGYDYRVVTPDADEWKYLKPAF